jgi:pimeloyl-ACP methyl ester carboxylesterase
MAVWSVVLLVCLSLAIPNPPGRLVDAAGHTIHVNCTGRGRPTVVIETGLGDFSFDWILVQQQVQQFTRVCTYDRAGYAWSERGPWPRTFDQLNFELRQALAANGEQGPFVLVGHSYGGGVVRQFALSHPTDVAGLVFVDIVAEHQYLQMGSHAGRIGDGAKGRTIPTPVAGRGPGAAATAAADTAETRLESPYDHLPVEQQRLHRWAASQPGLDEVEDSQREWSTEYFARWTASSQKGSLRDIPLIVLTRAAGGFGQTVEKTADELERARLDAQRQLAELSSRSSHRIVETGHNIHLEKPAVVTRAIQDVILLTHML